MVSHTPTCLCLNGFSGDPFVQCLDEQCKVFFLVFFVFKELDILKVLHLCGLEGRVSFGLLLPEVLF